MAEKKSAPTMKDVAREAGVSLGTVSKVVNGIPVGKEYKDKVEAAIGKLEYRINSYAKGLKSSQTYTVAVMVPNLISPFFARLVDAINRSLSARQYRMLFYATDYDPEQEQELVMLAEQQKVDGIICLSYNLFKSKITLIFLPISYKEHSILYKYIGRFISFSLILESTK